MSLLSPCSLLNVDKFVLNVRSVVAEVDAGDLLRGLFDFGPAVNLQTKVLLHHIGVGVADGDHLALFDDVELLIEGHHLDASILVTDDALSNSVHSSSVIPSALASDLDGTHLEVHVDTSARLELGHRDEYWFAKGGFLSLLGFYHINSWPNFCSIINLTLI